MLPSGRAIVRGPDVFLFDEPLSNLDAELRVEMRTELARLHQSLDSTMVYVTHDQVEAMTLADKIVVLRAGRIEQVGSPMTLYTDPDNKFVAGFIGSPGMNFLSGSLQGNQLKLDAIADGTFTPRPDRTCCRGTFRLGRFAATISKANGKGTRFHGRPDREFGRRGLCLFGF